MTMGDPVKGQYSTIQDRDNAVFAGHIRAGAVTLEKLSNDVVSGLSGQSAPAVFVNTINGRSSNGGTSWDDAFDTMAAGLLHAEDHATIYVIGDVREQLDAPLGVQGVKIVGGAGGHVRHDDGVRWRAPASPTADTPLLTLREQGWEVHNILFQLDATNGTVGIRLRRAEDATWPDGSHAIISGCKFIGSDDTPAGIGIQSHGGSSHDIIANNEFFGLVTAIAHLTGAGIAAPLRWQILGNWFATNTNHIVLPANQSIIDRNFFDPATVVINSSGAAEGKNYVVNNQFSDALADIDNAHGYTGHAADIWRNYSADTAATTVGVPGA